MAEKAKEKNTKKIIAIVACAVAVVVAIVVAVVLINKNKGEVLNDDFFKTTNEKIVISNTADSTDPTVAKKVHQVYFINGDKITGLKVYSEFESEQAAKDADAKPEVAEAMKTGMYKEHKVEGKYIIVTMADSVYQSTNVEQLKAAATVLEKAVQEQPTQQQAEPQTQTVEQNAEETVEE